MVSWPLDDASVWFENQAILAPTMQDNVTDPLNDLNERLGTVGSPVTTGIFTVANSSVITAQRGYIEGDWAVVYCAYTIGVGITVPTDGNFANATVLNIAAAYQSTMTFTTWGLQEAGIGRGADHVVSGSTILLAAVAGSLDIASGDAFSFSGRYPLS